MRHREQKIEASSSSTNIEKVLDRSEKGKYREQVLLFSCIITVRQENYGTDYRYRAEENAKETAAKKAYKALCKD